jgi:hypothetical protein
MLQWDEAYRIIYSEPIKEMEARIEKEMSDSTDMERTKYCIIYCDWMRYLTCYYYNDETNTSNFIMYQRRLYVS